MDVTYLDFSQAFNAVSPSFLVSKLGYHGLDGGLLDVWKNWPDHVVVGGLYFT